MPPIAVEIIQRQIAAKKKSIDDYEAEIARLSSEAKILAGLIEMEAESLDRLQDKLIELNEAQPTESGSPSLASPPAEKPAATPPTSRQQPPDERDTPAKRPRSAYAVDASHGAAPAEYSGIFPPIVTQDPAEAL